MSLIRSFDAQYSRDKLNFAKNLIKIIFSSFRQAPERMTFFNAQVIVKVLVAVGRLLERCEKKVVLFWGNSDFFGDFCRNRAGFHRFCLRIPMDTYNSKSACGNGFQWLICRLVLSTHFKDFETVGQLLLSFFRDIDMHFQLILKMQRRTVIAIHKHAWKPIFAVFGMNGNSQRPEKRVFSHFHIAKIIGKMNDACRISFRKFYPFAINKIRFQNASNCFCDQRFTVR